MTLCGSLRDGSVNAARLRTARRSALPGITFGAFAESDRLPFFDPDDDREPLNAAVAAFRGRIAAADAILFSTPEYAGALPGAF